MPTRLCTSNRIIFCHSKISGLEIKKKHEPRIRKSYEYVRNGNFQFKAYVHEIKFKKFSVTFILEIYRGMMR